MKAEVRRLRVNREGGHTHLHDKHFKTWLRETFLVKEATTLPSNH